MAVRNSRELGENLLKIMEYLSRNKNLLKLLKYTDKEPLAHEENVNPADIIGKNIRVVPLVNESEDNTESTIVISFPDGTVSDNTEFKRLSLHIFCYVPLEKWTLNDINLRPFLIMSEVESSLKNARVNGLGTIMYEGFDLALVTDVMSVYKMEFSIDVFN